MRYVYVSEGRYNQQLCLVFPASRSDEMRRWLISRRFSYRVEPISSEVVRYRLLNPQHIQVVLRSFVKKGWTNDMPNLAEV